MMNYDKPFNGEQSWIISETNFELEHLGKTEAVLYLGNGYMGVRSSNEETYVTTKRGHFIAGTFNSFADEVCELPNSADVTRLDIFVDGERVSLTHCNHRDYEKQLNLKTVELTRTFTYISDDKKAVKFHFRRFVSFDDLHLIAFKVDIETDSDVHIALEPFIDGQVSNSGSQHFIENEKRMYNQTTIEYIQTTTESAIDFIIHAAHQLTVPNEYTMHMNIDRRLASLQYDFTLKAHQKASLEKFVTVHTTRDLVFSDFADLQAYRQFGLAKMNEIETAGYDALFEKHQKQVDEKIWHKFDLVLESENAYDLLALRFAHYHLIAMAPSHDARMGIAAKALSGEGYKGHSFWDTELFILPFFTFTDPAMARQLLQYRYLGLQGARKKARENEYLGAMYPWEAAWPSDGEVTPVWGAVDVVTGKQTKIWSGFIEQHISADIIFALWQYYRATKDQAFLDKYGYEMIFDVANFWASRLEWNEAAQQYHINNVIGPDEYKEHVNNNAFTNYMADFTLCLAIRLYEQLATHDTELLANIGEKINLVGVLENWQEKENKLFLPQPNDALVIAQDDSYLSKEIFDLTKYKKMDQVGMLFKEYSLDQVNEMQVTKQADVVILMYLLEDQFNHAIKLANYEYYEPKTTHDSSLSLSTHTIIANDLGDQELAYHLFERVCRIDLGENMKSSDHGIHSASIGGIWQSTVFGFAGVRLRGETLHIAPKLPEAWLRFTYTIEYLGEKIRIDCDKHTVTITPLSGNDITITVYGESTTISKATKFEEKSDLV